jgi:hypothetical protein
MMMMETTQFVQPVVNANKIAFQTWFQSVSAMQDQAEQMMNYVWNQTPMVPESSKKVVNEWVNLLKKERENVKKTVDQSFESLEQLLAGTEAKQEKAKSTASSSSKSASA